MIHAAVIGASGYAGARLLGLLAHHPNFHVVAAVGHTHVGTPVARIHPQLRHAYADMSFTAVDDGQVSTADIVFIALPHGQSANVVTTLPHGTLVVDLGADFRLRSPHAWQQYYAGQHAGSWTYGLADVPHFANQVMQATRVANPGCYATALALSVAPAVSAGLIDATDIVAVAASGTSGAGRSADVSLSATEVIGSMRAYKVGGVHQHTPEVEQTLSELGATAATVSFTPLLAPMPHGIHATVTAPTMADESTLRAAYAQFYVDSAFVSVLDSGEQGRTGDVVGTNDAHISVHLDEHSGRLVTTCVIDNLGKGAAGQAIQNANLMLGLPPTQGLSSHSALQMPAGVA